MCDLSDLCDIIPVFSIFVAQVISSNLAGKKTKILSICASKHYSKYVYICPRVTSCPLFYSDEEEIVEIPPPLDEP